MRLFAESSLFSFRGGPLYRDHAGRNVVADVEGTGTFSASEAEVWADGEEAPLQGSFERHVVAYSESKRFMFDALTGPLPKPETGSPTRTSDGPGWIVSSSGPVSIDGFERQFPAIAGLPRPFFICAQCERGMEVVRSPQRVELIDRFDVFDTEALKSRDWQVQNASDVFSLVSAFQNGTPREGRHMSHLNVASWSCSVPDRNQGIVLRKLYDRFHGRQRARVLIDWAPVGTWYEPEGDRGRRWAWAQFGVPERFTAAKEHVRISIDPHAGTPLWDVSRIEVLALLAE